MEKNLLLQRLYRLLMPDQFLNLDLFLNWCLELGSLYQDQLGKGPSNHPIAYSSNCFDDNNNNNGSTALSPPSPPPTLFAPIMTRDSSNASTGSLPSSSGPPSPALTIPSSPSINDQSNPGMYFTSDASFHTSFDGTSAASSASSSQPDNLSSWIGDTLSAPDSAQDTAFSTNDTVYTFWIHPDNLLEVTMYLAKYMDVIKPSQQPSHSLANYEIDSPEHQTCFQDSPAAHSSSSQQWQPITTLYMDTPDLANYTNRIRNTSDTNDDDDNGSHISTVPSLRLRQYNNIFSRVNDSKYITNHPCSSVSFYSLEKKTHVSKPRRSKKPASSSTSSVSMSSTYTGDSSKKIGKKAYRQHHHRHEPSPSWSSIHSRIWLKSKRCKPWLNHQWSLKNVLIKSSPSHHYKSFGKHDTNRKHIEKQILEMESDLQTYKLEPVLRTSVNRIGFKWTDDHDNIDDRQKKDVTITIDTDITMTRYDDNQVTKDPLQQDDYPCATSPSNDLTRFPYALLCVKLPHDFSDTGAVKSTSSSSLSSPSFTPSCSWLAQIFSCPMLEPVQDFSLYLHGTSVLFPDKIDVLPHWFGKMDLDLQRMDTQGYLSGLRRVYHHLQHQRQHSNKSSSQDSASDPTTPWSFTNTTLTVSSTKGSSSPNHSETRATTPEPMDTSFAETSQEHTLPLLHPLGHESNPTINYFACTTSTDAPSSSTDSRNQKPYILLSPAPVTSPRSPSLDSSPSSAPVPNERTPLLPSLNDCDIRHEPTSSTSNLKDVDHQQQHYNESILPSYQKQISSSSSSSSSSNNNKNKISRQMYKIVNWISALAWPRKKGLDQQDDNYHTSIDIPSNDTMETSTATHLYDTPWEDTMVMAKRPVPLTLLCGVVSFIVAYILYVVVTL
ncbi:unnamed protein product [Absidia cylindrospora]